MKKWNLKLSIRSPNSVCFFCTRCAIFYIIFTIAVFVIYSFYLFCHLNHKMWNFTLKFSYTSLKAEAEFCSFSLFHILFSFSMARQITEIKPLSSYRIPLYFQNIYITVRVISPFSVDDVLKTVATISKNVFEKLIATSVEMTYYDNCRIHACF